MFTRAPLLLTIFILVPMICSLMPSPNQLAVSDENNPLEVLPLFPLNLHPSELGPDNVVVALADFKFEEVNDRGTKTTIHVKCTGTISRIIAGSDSNKAVEFDCSVMSVRGKWRFYMVRSNSGVACVGSVARVPGMLNSGEAKDCLMVYQREKDGSTTIFNFEPNGLELAPTYEWLENTKNRKEDRLPLATMVLMDKTASKDLRRLAYRIIYHSNLSFESQFEIIRKAMEVGANPSDTGYGLYVLANAATSRQLTMDETTSVVRYLLQGLAASKDAQGARVWLRGLSDMLQRLKLQDYPDLCAEIADAITKHEVTSSENAQDMADYDHLKKSVLDQVQPKQPAPEEEPAPPAEGGGTPPASEPPAPPSDTGNP